jgi:hypothetical protein
MGCLIDTTLRALRGLGLGLATLWLVGCASPITAKVTNFNAWPADAAGATFSYAATAQHRGELEQATYEGYVGAELTRLGLRQAPAGQTGRLLVEVFITEAERKKTVMEPVYDNALTVVQPWGSMTSAQFMSGPRYVGDRAVEKTVQVDSLRVRIMDTQGMAPGGKPRTVYSSTAVYEGQDEDLPHVMPFLARALFQDFPGRSGRVTSLSYDASTGERKR